MESPQRFEFRSPPGVWPSYLRVVFGRKPATVPPGVLTPRLEGRTAPATANPARVAAYARVCGLSRADIVPLAYPHTQASGMHLAMLSSAGFPVSALGLVHLRNIIVRRRAWTPDEPLELRAWMEGHREGDWGQEFEMETEGLIGGEPVWRETCIFLARRRGRPTAKRDPEARRRSAAAALEAEHWKEGAEVTQSEPFDVPAGLGRRYARVSGDYNPIHIADLVARPFGFPKAIVHGMWSLAHCSALVGEAQLLGPVELDVSFKLPVTMPATLVLESRHAAGVATFAMKDADTRKPHLTGRLRPLTA